MAALPTGVAGGGGGGPGAGGGAAAAGSGDGATTDDGDEAPPPPPPPTRAEALATCATPPQSAIGRDPTIRGLTGLETRLWAQHHTPLVTSGDIRGYPVRCTATPYRWHWDTGDGSRYAVNAPGGPHPDNLVAHTYETKNPDYTLRLQVSWQRVTNYGSDHLTTETTQPYRVIEVRSYLTDPDEQP